MRMFFVFLVLLTLKMYDVIDWPWWLVTAPLWATVIIVAVYVVAVALQTRASQQ